MPLNNHSLYRRNFSAWPSNNQTGHRLRETELIQSLQEREEQAFETLLAFYKDRVYNTVLGFVQNDADAEDVTQDVFIKLHQRINGFRQEAGLATWIYRIAVTQSIDFLRMKARRKKGGFLNRLFDNKTDVLDEPDFHHPGVAVEQKEAAAVLFKAISKLPVQQRTAFLLQKTEGLSGREIADVMQTSVGAVESLLYRAVANLRKLLASYYQTHYR